MTTPEQDIILETLGYYEVPEGLPRVTTNIMTLCTRLTVIDSQIDTGLTDSMAVTVGELSVDFGRHIQLLKQEGSRILKTISAMSGIPIKYDRYLGRSPGEVTTSPMSVKTYW